MADLGRLASARAAPARKTLDAKRADAVVKAMRGHTTMKDGSGHQPSKAAFAYLRAGDPWKQTGVGNLCLEASVPDEEGVFAEMPLSVGDISRGAEPFLRASGGEGNCGVGVLGTQAAVEQQATRWAEIWKAAATLLDLPVAAIFAVMRRLTGDDLRRAALTFPASTGLSHDAMSPRCFARLPTAALDLLAGIFMMCEEWGLWPELVEMVVIVLIPKDDGDTRPIHLYSALVRLWGRSRHEDRAKWEAEYDRDAFYGSTGKAAPRVAWQSAFQAEAAHLLGTRHLHGLFDISKAFETADRRKLVDAALRHQYPVRMLVLSLKTYSFSRVMKLRGALWHRRGQHVGYLGAEAAVPRRH